MYALFNNADIPRVKQFKVTQFWVKVKFTLERPRRPGVGSRYIVLLFL